MPDDEAWFSLEEMAQRLGSLVWVEERLFEILGEWSASEPVHRAAVLFATASRHHGWHAQVLRDCLPTASQLQDAAQVKAPTEGWATAVDSLRSFSGDEATLARLTSLVRVVDPWVALEIGALVDVSTSVSDGGVVRWMRFAELDHEQDGFATAELLDELQANTVSFTSRAAVAALDL